MMQLTDNEKNNLRDQVNKLKALLDAPLWGNKAWELKISLAIRTISDYEDF